MTVVPPSPDDGATLDSGTEHHEQHSGIRERPDRPFHPSNQRPRRVPHDINQQQETPNRSRPRYRFGVLTGRASSSNPPSRWCFRSVSHGLPPVSVCSSLSRGWFPHGSTGLRWLSDAAALMSAIAINGTERRLCRWRTAGVYRGHNTTSKYSIG